MLDFDINGEITTNIGDIVTDFSVYRIDDIPTYQGSLSGKQINIGEILSNPSLNYCNLNLDVNGQDFSLANLKTKFSGVINQISYNGIFIPKY